jgi:hypothetical protein
MLVNSGYLVPIRFDDASLVGLPNDTCYLDARRLTLRTIARIVTEKIEADKTPVSQKRVSLSGLDEETLQVTETVMPEAITER